MKEIRMKKRKLTEAITEVEGESIDEIAEFLSTGGGSPHLRKTGRWKEGHPFGGRELLLSVGELCKHLDHAYG